MNTARKGKGGWAAGLSIFLAVRSWVPYLQRLVRATERVHGTVPKHTVGRLKQWLQIASLYGDFPDFARIKRAESVEHLLATLSDPVGTQRERPIAAMEWVYAGLSGSPDCGDIPKRV